MPGSIPQEINATSQTTKISNSRDAQDYHSPGVYGETDRAHVVCPNTHRASQTYGHYTDHKERDTRHSPY